jgi:glycosyltransferase involved in cell wall biosynthesis
MNNIRPIRVCFVSIHPAPYRDPFFNRLAQRPEVDLKVYTFLKQDRDHDFWKLPPPEYPNTYLACLPFVPAFFKYQWSVMRLVLGGGHDLYVFPGFLIRASVTGMLVCAIIGKPYVYNADSVEDGPAQRGIVGRLRHFLISRASLLFVPGKASEAYFHERHGVPRDRICHGCYAMDALHIEERLAAARERRATIRRDLGIGDADTMFLMVANMIKGRRYPVNAAGFLEMAKRHPAVRFVMVGSGEDFETMNRLAAEHPELVVKRGCSFDEMLGLYGAADVYVHGGKEPASTALVIGALAKLPLVSSFAVGHAWDCLVDGVSGVVVEDHTSPSDWTEGFERIMARRSDWPAVGQAAREAARALEVEPSVDTFVKCAQTAISLRDTSTAASSRIGPNDSWASKDKELPG